MKTKTKGESREDKKKTQNPIKRNHSIHQKKSRCIFRTNTKEKEEESKLFRVSETMGVGVSFLK